MTELSQMILNVTLIMEYLVPGAIFLAILRRTTGYKPESNAMFALVSVVISYINKTVMRCFHTLLFGNVHIDDDVKFCLLIVSAAVVSVLLSIAYQSKWFKSVFNRAFTKSFNDNIWLNLIDLGSTDCVIMTMKNDTMIVGQIKEIEENGNESWIALYGYTCDASYSNLKWHSCDFADHDCVSYLMVRIADIVQVQVFKPSEPLQLDTDS